MKTFSLQKTLASRLIFSIALIGILSILTNCGGGGGGSTNDNNQNNNLTAGQAALSGTVQPDPSSPTPADGQNAGATVYVVGQPNNTATTDGSGNFNLTIDATLSGTVLSGRSFKRTDPATKTYELIVISGAKGHGRKVEVPVVAGVVNPLSTIYINTVGSISGKAYLQGQTDHTGIRVYIPGTSFQANTDAAGNYTISNVPSGTYDLVRADYPGTVYHYAIVANVTVTTNQTVTLPDMLLQTSVGASGSVLINSGDAFTTSTSVKLSIAPSDNAVLMAISEDPTFSGTLTWEPVKSTRDYTFAGAYSPGATATIYVKFADMSGLPTAGSASDSIYIDTNPLATKDAPGTPISNTKPTLQWHYTPPMPSPTYHVQLATDTGFVHIVAGQDQTGLTPAQWTVSTALNQGFYYWRVAIIDSTGHQWNWSGPWSFEINLYTVTLTAPTDTSFTNNATPTFTWTANTNAATYNFVLSANADLSSPLFNTTDIVGTSYPLPASPALTDGTFYWAVTPVDGNGISGTRSAIQSFTLDTVAPSGMNIGTCTDHAGGNCTGIMITSNNAPLITGLNYSTGPTATVPIHASDSNGVASYCMKTGFSGSTTTCPGTPCPSGNWISTGSDPLPTDYVTALSTQLSVGNPWPILYACVWFKDKAGNVSPGYYDDIHYMVVAAPQNPYSTTGTGQYTSIANPNLVTETGISFYDNNNHRLMFVYGAGSWNSVIADNSTNVGTFTSLATENHSTAQTEAMHVSYFDASNSKIKHVTLSPSVATAENVTGALVGGFNYSAIALDTNNKPHVLYMDQDTGKTAAYGLWYTNKTSGAWSAPEVIDSYGWESIGQYPSLLIDGSNKLHISYQNGSMAHLKYAEGTSGAWTVLDVDTSGTVASGSHSKIVMDGNGALHISYACNSGTTCYGGGICYVSNYGVKHASCSSSCGTAANWTTEWANQNTAYSNAPETAIQTCKIGGVVSTHIIFTKDDQSLWYTTNRYGSWSSVQLDSNASNVAMALCPPSTSSCNLCISYYDSVNQKLKYNQFTPPAP